MKYNTTILIAGMAAMCATASSQEILENWSLVEVTDSPDASSSMPEFGGGGGSTRSSETMLATTGSQSNPKDFSTAPVAKTLIGGDGGGTSRPSYEGRAYRRPSTPSQRSSSPSTSSRSSTKGGIAEQAPVIETDTSTDLSFMIEGGYYSNYFYHGLDQIRSTSKGGPDDIGVGLVGVSASWNGFFFGYKFAFADEETKPAFHPATTLAATPDQTYSEHILEGGYTLGILPEGWLDATASYQHILFGEELFWGHQAQGRVMIKAAINRFQWFRPSLAYYNFAGHGEIKPRLQGLLDGQQIIAQVEGSGQFLSYGRIGVGLSYYAMAAYDKGYNAADNGFEDLDFYQVGIALPVVMDSITIAPSFHWLGNQRKGSARKGKDDTWLGLNATYSF